MDHTTDGVPKAGRYPDGLADELRAWDGHSWTSVVSTRRGVPGGPDRVRVPTFLWHWRFWVVVGGLVAAGGLGFAADQSQGSWLAYPAVVGTAATLFVLVSVAWQKLRLSEAAGGWTVLGWGVLGGVVGFALALGGEATTVRLLGAGDDSLLGNVIAGPFEETAKLVVPVLLYLLGRYRDPRAGFAIVLVGAAVFGLMEGVEYLRDASSSGALSDAVAATPARVQHPAEASADGYPITTSALQRSLAELLHPVITGYSGAVLWLFAWHRGRLVTAAGIGAWLLAMAVHSAIDTGTRLPGAWDSLVAIPLIVITYYVMYRPNARMLAGPATAATNTPSWRPRLAKSRALAAPK